MLLRIVAVLSCAAYAAAVQCAECVGIVEGYHLDLAAVCHLRREGTQEIITQCEWV